MCTNLWYDAGCSGKALHADYFGIADSIEWSVMTVNPGCASEGCGDHAVSSQFTEIGNQQTDHGLALALISECCRHRGLEHTSIDSHMPFGLLGLQRFEACRSAIFERSICVTKSKCTSRSNSSL